MGEAEMDVRALVVPFFEFSKSMTELYQEYRE